MRTRLIRYWRDWRGFLLFIAVMLVFRSAVADWNQVPSGSMKPGILDGDRIVVDKLAWDLRVPFTRARVSRWADPARGDVVTFENPVDNELFVKRVVAVPGDTVEWRHRQLAINGERAAYTPLAGREIRAMPVASGRGHRFYRERLLGSTRVIMVRHELGPRDATTDPLVGLGRFARGCPNYDIVTAAASQSLAAAICRCGGPANACSTFPRFTVPEGKYWVMGDNRDNSSDSRVIGLIDRQRIYGRAHAIAFSVDKSRYYLPRLGRFFTSLAWTTPATPLLAAP